MKRFAVLLLQLLVTGAIVFYIWHDKTRRVQIADALRHADWHWLFIGWACYAGVEILGTIRWQILLRAQFIRVSWLHAAAIVVVGLFCNVFLPGLVGGDALRLYFIFKEAPWRKTRAALSIVMDRLLGLLTLVLLAAAMVWLRFDWFKRSTGTLDVVYIALALLGGGFVLAVLFFCVAAFDWLDRLPKKFPLRNSIFETANALNLYRSRPLGLSLALLITVAAHIAYFLTYYCAGRSLRTGVSAFDMISIMPLVNTITSIPISLGGVGVRETLFQRLLGDLVNVPPAAAILTASLGFALQASWGLVGFAAYIVLRRTMRRRNASPA